MQTFDLQVLILTMSFLTRNHQSAYEKRVLSLRETHAFLTIDFNSCPEIPFASSDCKEKSFLTILEIVFDYLCLCWSNDVAEGLKVCFTDAFGRFQGIK